MTTATLNWVLPTTRSDDTPTHPSPLPPTEIASIAIFDANATVPGGLIGTVPGPATSFTTGALAAGDHTFSVVVVDTAGQPSVHSNAVTVNVVAQVAAPNPATNLTVVLNP